MERRRKPVEAGHAELARVDRRVLKTRAAIEAAFRKLVREQGLGKLTVSSLAREADIDRKTFYLHYDSIDDLLDQIAEGLVTRVLARAEDPGLVDSPRGQVAAALDEANAIILEDLDLYRYIAANLSFDFVLDHIGCALRRFAERHVASDVLADERFGYLARFYLVGAISVYSQWLQSDRNEPIEQVSGLLVDVLADGLGRAFGANAPRPAEVSRME